MTITSIIHPVIAGRAFIAQGIKRSCSIDYHYFTTNEVIRYDALCDDFGPMNMASVIRFVQLLDAQLDCHPQGKIVYLVDSGRRALTNAIFLMGAYLVLRKDYTARQASEVFSWAEASLVEAFRDATYEAPDFDLTLLDCWQGLEKGKQMGWVAVPTGKSSLWGRIDPEEYDQFDDPLNADLHEVVPGKFVAFKGPKNLGKVDYHDDKHGYRCFSANHYARIFKFLKVKTVVRLNEPEYDAKDFEEHGLKHAHLEFPDCTAPPAEVVEAFLRAADAPGSVAVHCKAGLGRTGTLIALYMMRTHGFSARAAIGWLRIMRPGCVIGEQQHYLCHVEACLPRPGAAVDNRLAAPAPAPAPAAVDGAARSAAIAAQVAEGMERRGAARNNNGRSAASAASPEPTGEVAAGSNKPRSSWLPSIRSALSRATAATIVRVR